MDTKQALQLLRDYDVYESAFRTSGTVFANVTRGDGDDAVTTQESYDLSVKEFVGTDTAPWMFPRVVSNVMNEAAEPVLMVTPLLNTVRVGGGIRTVDYYAVGAIQAHEIPEAGEYPEEQTAWSRGSKSARVTKKGLKIPITQEMVDDSLFDVMAMYMRAAGRAMARYKESLALARFLDAAKVVIDNTDAAVPDSSGVNSLGAANGSLDAEDLMYAFGQMLASGRTPTDILIHPLAWTMWANDPVMQNLTWIREPLSRAATTQQRGVDGRLTPLDAFREFLQKTAPFGINVITTPYLPYDPATKVTDVLVIDRNDIGALTVREDITTDQFDDPTRDIVAMKIRERYDITVFTSEGYNITRLNDIKVVRNYGRDVSFSTLHDETFPGE